MIIIILLIYARFGRCVCVCDDEKVAEEPGMKLLRRKYVIYFFFTLVRLSMHNKSL